MHPYLLKGIGLGPTVVERLVGLIPEALHDSALGEDRFTLREVIAHLADWEVLFRGRMETALAVPGSRVVVLDEGDRAVELKYAETDVTEQLAIYKAERAKTVEFLSALAKEDFRLTYIHPAFGVMVIEDQANMLIGHDMYHVEQLTAYLSL
jgi:hypothetical protein